MIARAAALADNPSPKFLLTRAAKELNTRLWLHPPVLYFFFFGSDSIAVDGRCFGHEL